MLKITSFAAVDVLSLLFKHCCYIFIKVCLAPIEPPSLLFNVLYISKIVQFKYIKILMTLKIILMTEKALYKKCKLPAKIQRVYLFIFFSMLYLLVSVKHMRVRYIYIYIYIVLRCSAKIVF